MSIVPACVRAGSQESQWLSQAATDSHPSQASSSSSSGFQVPTFSTSSRPNAAHYAHHISHTGDVTSNAPSVQGVGDSDNEEPDGSFDQNHIEEKQPSVMEMQGYKEDVTRHTETDSFTSLVTSFKQHIWKHKRVSIEEFMSPYKINPPPHKHGCAIIINIAMVPGFSVRKGAEKDQENLEKVFTELRYDVKVLSELKKEGFKSVSEQVQATNYRDSDSFVCCFLSHGDIVKGQEVIFLADGTSLTIDDVKKMAVENKSLVGKPKLFFIQACWHTLQ